MNKTAFAGLFIAIFLLPGCIKYYELSTTEFPQGELIQAPSLLKKNYVRSAKIYNEFATVASFDALLLAPEVRTFFAERSCNKRGKDKETTKAIKSRQLEETNHWIGFYVLADIRTRNNTALKEKNAAWTLYLTIEDTVKLEPLSIKEVELEPEYQTVFGQLFNNFKNVYLVKFPAHSIDGKAYTGANKPKLKLTFAGPKHECSALWDTQSCSYKETGNDEDFYWG